MAIPRTVTQLIADIRQYADMENSQFVSDSEMIRRINESNARLYGIIANVGLAQNYFLSSIEYTTVPGDAFLTISSHGAGDNPINLDIYQIVGVDRLSSSGGNKIALSELQWQDRNSFQQGIFNNLYHYNDNKYRIHGLGSRLDVDGSGGLPISTVKLELFPTPTSAETIIVHMIQGAPELTVGTDSVSYPNKWETWISLDVAIQVMNKEESDARSLIFERERIELEIKNQASSADRGEVQRVRDTRAASLGIGRYRF